MEFLSQITWNGDLPNWITGTFSKSLWKCTSNLVWWITISRNLWKKYHEINSRYSVEIEFETDDRDNKESEHSYFKFTLSISSKTLDASKICCWGAPLSIWWKEPVMVKSALGYYVMMSGDDRLLCDVFWSFRFLVIVIRNSWHENVITWFGRLLGIHVSQFTAIFFNGAIKT